MRVSTRSLAVNQYLPCMQAPIGASSFGDIGDAPPSFPGNRPFKLALDRDNEVYWSFLHALERMLESWGIVPSTVVAGRGKESTGRPLLPHAPDAAEVPNLLRPPASLRDYLRLVPALILDMFCFCVDAVELGVPAYGRDRPSSELSGGDLGLLRSAQCVVGTAVMPAKCL